MPFHRYLTYIILRCHSSSTSNIIFCPKKGSLVCYFRYQDETVPGCSGPGEFGEDYCCNRALNYMFYVGNDGDDGSFVFKDPDNYEYPLGHCEGDCDTDDDCEGDDLICQQRSGTTSLEEKGCDGVGRSGYDYCVYSDFRREGSVSTSLLLQSVLSTSHPSASPIGMRI